MDIQYIAWLQSKNEEAKKLFEEFVGLSPDDVAEFLCEQGFRMHAPFRKGCEKDDIVHNCVTAQWIRKKTTRPVVCGTTAFMFEDQGENKTLRHLPENITLFTQGSFTGKYPQVYVEEP